MQSARSTGILFVAALTASGCFIDRAGTQIGDGGTVADSSRADAGDGGSVDADGATGCGADTDWTCTDGERSRCIGGAVESARCELGCSRPFPTQCSLARSSNVDIDYDSEVSVTIDGVVDVDTSACASTPPQSWDLARVGGLCVARVRDLSVGAGGFVDVAGDAPFVILAANDIDVAGTLDGSAFGATPGPGGSAPGDAESGGDGPNGQHASGGLADSGGAGGSMCGRGGGGGGASGFGSIGQNPSRVPFAMLDYDGEPLSGGFAGGDGRHDRGSGDAGGGGGGAIQLSAGRAVTVAGRVSAGGGGASGGFQSLTGDSVGSGAGGGSGGVVLLEAPTVTVTGTLWAAGGGGGSTAVPWTDGEPGANAGAGGGATRPAGGNNGLLGVGGDGGGGSAVDGDSGRDSPGYPYNGGGGGGGSGCIIVRNQGASLPSLASSPASATSAVRVLEVVIE